MSTYFSNYMSIEYDTRNKCVYYSNDKNMYHSKGKIGLGMIMIIIETIN